MEDAPSSPPPPFCSLVANLLRDNVFPAVAMKGLGGAVGSMRGPGLVQRDLKNNEEHFKQLLTDCKS